MEAEVRVIICKQISFQAVGGSKVILFHDDCTRIKKSYDEFYDGYKFCDVGK